MFKFLEQLFCIHERIIRRDGARMWTQCIKCLHESEGISCPNIIYARQNRF